MFIKIITKTYIKYKKCKCVLKSVVTTQSGLYVIMQYQIIASHTCFGGHVDVKS